MAAPRTRHRSSASISARSLLAATMLGLVAGCTTMGGAAGPGDTPSPTRPAAPSASLPSATLPGATASATGALHPAIAAVLAEHPELADHVPIIDPGDGSMPGPPIGGPRDRVFVRADGDAWLVTFVTGVGDCTSGCTQHVVTTYRVTADGEVSLACTPGPSPIARRVPLPTC